MSEQQTVDTTGPESAAASSDAPGGADRHGDLPENRVMEPSWRVRLLILDGVLALGLAWILWDLYQGRRAAEADAPEEPAGIERPTDG